jgi:hydrogenase expression/formation protein HypE
MSLARIEAVARAVLYEGYNLYPYRPSAIKNRQRWTFGGVFPRDWAERDGHDKSAMQTQCLLEAAPRTRCIRDATRGGVATVLNEFAQASRVCIEIDENRTPLRDAVKGFCEILGLDPLYLANEGKLVAIVPPEEAQDALSALRRDPLGREAAIIGRVDRGEPGRVTMRTIFGGRRIVDMLVGEQLPRIC